MHSDAERTLNNLHVLAALSQNDKLLTNEDAFDIHAPTTLRAISRYWYRERRSSNIQRVRICVRAAMEFVSKSLDDANALVPSLVPSPPLGPSPSLGPSSPSLSPSPSSYSSWSPSLCA